MNMVGFALEATLRAANYDRRALTVRSSFSMFSLIFSPWNARFKFKGNLAMQIDSDLRADG